MNGAPAFFHPSVVQWLETNEIKYVLARHWPTNSLDLSPMEYRMHEILKNFSNHRNAATKSELVKGVKEVWSEIKIRKICRVIKSWPFCVVLMVEKLDF